MAVLGEQGRIEWVNQRLGHLLRREREELLGTCLDELMHPEDVQPGELDAAELRPGRVQDLGRKRLARPDGTFVWTGLTLSRFSTTDDVNRPAASRRERLRPHGARVRRGPARVGGGRASRIRSCRSTRAAASRWRTRPPQRLLGDLGPELVGLDMSRTPWEVIDEDGSSARPGRPSRAQGPGHRRARVRDHRPAPGRRDPVGRGRGAPVGAFGRALGGRRVQGRVRAPPHRGRVEGGRSGGPGQERVPVAHEPRAAHAVELGARLRAAAADRRPLAGPAGGRRPDPAAPGATCSACSTRCSTSNGCRAAAWKCDCSPWRPSRCCRPRSSSCNRSRSPVGSRSTCASGAAARPRCSPTSNGSGRCC